MSKPPWGSSALRLTAAVVLFVLAGCGGTSSTESPTSDEPEEAVTPQTSNDASCSDREKVADLDGDGQREAVFAADPVGPTVLLVCGSDLVVAPFDVDATNKPVQVYAVDIEGDGTSELLVGTTTGVGPFAGTLLRLVDGELVDQTVDVAVSPPRPGGFEGESFGCVDIDDDGSAELVSVAYQLDAPAVGQATMVNWSQTAVVGEAAGAGITREGVFDLGTERAQALAVMNGTCRDQQVIVGVTDGELAPPPPVVGPASQTAADAERDGVIRAIAVLPYEARVDPLLTEPANGGTWVLSRLTRDVIDASMDDGCALGDLTGDYPTEFICTSEYGELLLTDDAGQIQRAYPMPGAIPSWIHVTPSTIYAGRIGDGGLPNSTLVRIDREALVATVLVIPTGIDDIDVQQSLPDWRIAPEEQVTTYMTLVGFAPEMLGTPASSWIGNVVIDPEGIDALIDSN